MWQKTRHEPSLIADFLVPNSPSASLRSALLAAARVKFCCYCRILRQCKISYWTAMRFNSHSQLWQQHPKYSRSTRCCFMLLLISSLQRQACICHRQRLAASPPGCHSLPLARLRLRLAYPIHGAGKRAYRFYMHYQRNSILFCLSGYDFALLTHCTSTILRFCKAEFHI